MNRSKDKFGTNGGQPDLWSTVGDKRGFHSQHSSQRMDGDMDTLGKQDIRYTIEELLDLYQEGPIAVELFGKDDILEEPFIPICLTFDGTEELRRMWNQRSHNEYGKNKMRHRQRDYTPNDVVSSEVVQVDTIQINPEEEANAHFELKNQQKEMLRRLKQQSESVSPMSDAEEESIEPNETVASEVGAIGEQETAHETVHESVQETAHETVQETAPAKPASPSQDVLRREMIPPYQREQRPQPDLIPSLHNPIHDPLSNWTEPSRPPFTGPTIPPRDYLYDQILYSLLWYYIDCQDKIQGPFPTSQMRYWYEKGSLFDTLYISCKQNEWKMLKEYYPRTELAFCVLPATTLPLLTPPNIAGYGQSPSMVRLQSSLQSGVPSQPVPSLEVEVIRQEEELRLRLEEEAKRQEAERREAEERMRQETEERMRREEEEKRHQEEEERMRQEIEEKRRQEEEERSRLEAEERMRREEEEKRRQEAEERLRLEAERKKRQVKPQQHEKETQSSGEVSQPISSQTTQSEKTQEEKPTRWKPIQMQPVQSLSEIQKEQSQKKSQGKSSHSIPKTLFSQKLTPVNLATISSEGSTVKKSWGAIPPVVAQPISLQSQTRPKAVSNPKPTSTKAGKTRVEASSKSSIVEDKSNEVASLLKTVNQATKSSIKPVINFSSLPTLKESSRTKGKH